ncbi:hypothetical protein [Halorubrum trueperi]|uniref:DNA primase/polymerase bifunctional N-terminal domain-containing protein n=1 Tax=Halorubrum trueperi TaxID=2004704 RepID=A0ABD5UIF5_9EURY
MTSPESNTHDCLNVSDKSDNIEKYLEIFGETPVFNSVKAGEKAGFKNWDNPDKLKTANEIGFLLSRHRNIGIRLGVQTDRGYTVVFDKESYGDIPDNLLESISELAVASWQSQSGGDNNLLTVTQEAYEYLDQFKTKVTFEGDKHDLELLTSGYALVPPSRIDEDHKYDDLRTNPEAPTVNIDALRDILTHIPVSRKNEGNTSNQSEKQHTAVEIDTLPDSFDIESYCEDNLPGTDSFRERLNHVITDIDKVNELWFAEPEDQSENEIALRRELAWYFYGDKIIIQYIFEQMLPEFRGKELKYGNNETHTKDVLDFEEYVSRPYYINALSFNFREQLANKIHQYETVTATKIHNDGLINTNTLEKYDARTIRRGLQLFKELDLIERNSKTEYENKRIDEQYLEELEKVNNNPDYMPIKHPDY